MFTFATRNAAFSDLAYLGVERKVKQFEVLEERAADSSTLDDERVPAGDVVQHAARDALARLSDTVVDVQTRTPVLVPLYPAAALHTRGPIYRQSTRR